MDNRNKRFKKKTSFDRDSLNEKFKKSYRSKCQRRDKLSKIVDEDRHFANYEHPKSVKSRESFKKNLSTKDFKRGTKFYLKKDKSQTFNPFNLAKKSKLSDFTDFDKINTLKKRKVKLNIDTYKEYVDYIANNDGAYKTVLANQKETEALLKFIGLCKKAGALVQGASIVDDNLSKHKISLLIIASDASKNAKKLFKHKIEQESLATVYFSNKKELASILGRDEVVYIGITDKNFAKGLWEKFIKLLK